jgi:hypothetical protein
VRQIQQIGHGTGFWLIHVNSVASVNFICSPEEAGRRIKRVEQLGFQEILIGLQFGAIQEIERVRDFLKS